MACDNFVTCAAYARFGLATRAMIATDYSAKLVAILCLPVWISAPGRVWLAIGPAPSSQRWATFPARRVMDRCGLVVLLGKFPACNRRGGGLPHQLPVVECSRV
jgi:hypothetical protein